MTMTLAELKKMLVLSMKEGNKEKRSAIQQWIQNFEITKSSSSGTSKPEEELIADALSRTIKKLQSNISEYEKIGQEDFIKQETDQLLSIIDFAPKKMNIEELESEIKIFVRENEFKNFVDAMKSCVVHFKGVAENKDISSILKTLFK